MWTTPTGYNNRRGRHWVDRARFTPVDLQYACRYWAHNDSVVWQRGRCMYFSQKQLLFWLQALSLPKKKKRPMKGPAGTKYLLERIPTNLCFFNQCIHPCTTFIHDVKKIFNSNNRSIIWKKAILRIYVAQICYLAPEIKLSSVTTGPRLNVTSLSDATL